MAGWGIEPIVAADGTVTSGTTSEEVRRVWRALYSPGLIRGGEITTSASAMTYTNKPGVVAVGVAPGENAMVYFPGTTQTVATNTGTTTRVDKIYVQQVVPGTSNAIIVDVAEGVAPPAGSQVIATYNVPASATTTSTATPNGTIDFSVPYGANLGVFFFHTDTSNATIPTTVRTGASGNFSLATDRKILVGIDTCLSALRPDGTSAVGFDNSAYCEVKFEIFIDGIQRNNFNTPGLHQAWAVYHFTEYYNLAKGPHTISYRTRYTGNGPGTAVRHYSGSDLSTGTSLSVRDAGFWDSAN